MKTYIIITRDNTKQVGNIAKEKYSVFAYVGKSNRKTHCHTQIELTKRLAELNNSKNLHTVMQFDNDESMKQYCKETAQYLNN